MPKIHHLSIYFQVFPLNLALPLSLLLVFFFIVTSSLHSTLHSTLHSLRVFVITSTPSTHHIFTFSAFFSHSFSSNSVQGTLTDNCSEPGHLVTFFFSASSCVCVCVCVCACVCRKCKMGGIDNNDNNNNNNK